MTHSLVEADGAADKEHQLHVHALVDVRQGEIGDVPEGAGASGEAERGGKMEPSLRPQAQVIWGSHACHSQEKVAQTKQYRNANERLAHSLSGINQCEDSHVTSLSRQ